LPEGRLRDGKRNNASSISCDTRFSSTGFLRLISCRARFPAFVVKLLEAIEAVAAIAHHLAGLTHIAELFGKLQQPNFGPDDLLFCRHGVLQSAEAGRFATPTTPRPPPLSLCRGVRTPPSD